MYNINIKSKNDYYKIINYLFKTCDKFKVASMYGDVKNFEKSKHIDGLDTCLIEEKKVKRWPGMSKGPKRNMRIYLCNKITLKLFKEHKNFFEFKEDDGDGVYNTFNIEEQLDISFYNNDECILYTIGHEGMCVSQDKQLEKFLIKENIDFEEWIY